MKSAHKLPTLTLVAAMLGSVPSASAAVLLTVDVANATTTGIVVTATNGLSPITNSSFTQWDGISLAEFWGASFNHLDVGFNAPSSNLGVAGSNIAWTRGGSGSFFNGAGFDDPTLADFNIVTIRDHTAMSFITGATALTGSASFTYRPTIGRPSFDWSPLQTSPYVGNIYLGYGDNMGPLIGQYEIVNSSSVIPEPSSFAALAGLGALGFAALRRRRA